MWGLTRSEQGTYVPALWSDPTPRPDKRFSVLEKHTFLTLSLNPNSLKWARITSRCRTAIRSDELVGARVQGRREEPDIRGYPEGPALKSPRPLASGHSSRRLFYFYFWKWWSADLSLAREHHSNSDSFGEYEKWHSWMRSWNTIGAAPPSNPSWPSQPPRRKRGKHCALTREVSQKAPVYHI